MPLNLTKKTAVKGRGGIHVYVQLANEIRQAIQTGGLEPDDELPSAKVICQQTGLSREPVLKALDIIKGEGLTVSRPGMPMLVAQRRRPRVMGPARYREQLGRLRRGEQLPLQSAFTTENDVKWSQYTETHREFAERAVSALDRELLQLGDDVDTIWRRWFVRNIVVGGVIRPIEIVRSAIPMEIAAGTILMDVDADPTPGGTLEALFLNGYDPHLARHVVNGRAPSTRERELLQMQSADRVWDLLEIFTTANGTPIQAARTIMPMSGVTLEFETYLNAA
jgi:DNA-binding GntR family transcriptional regulator